MADTPMNVGKELLQVPFPEMVKAMAKGIAEAQFELDLMSVQIARMMSGAKDEDLVEFDGKKYSLLELGFMPSFYQFVDTIIEIKMSVSIGLEESKAGGTFSLDSQASAQAKMGFFSASGSASLHVSAVSASLASKYQYSAEGSSLMRTKLVPVPPPAILEKRIRDIADRAAAARPAQER